MSDEDDVTHEGAGESEAEGEEAMSPSDRRGEPRHLACFPAHVETAQGVPRSALIRDLSVTGALLLTRARVAVGDVIKLSLYLREGLEPRNLTARVVRHERRTGEMVHPWTKTVAVQFDAPLPELEDEARALADRQAALRGAQTPGQQ